MVLNLAADFSVATAGGDGEIIRDPGPDFQEQSKGQRRGIKRRAEIGGSGGQHELQL